MDLFRQIIVCQAKLWWFKQLTNYLCFNIFFSPEYSDAEKKNSFDKECEEKIRKMKLQFQKLERKTKIKKKINHIFTAFIFSEFIRNIELLRFMT